MDIATVLGVIIAISLILGSIILGGGTFGAFMDGASVMVVIGGSFAAAMISFPLKNFLGVFKVGMKTVFYKIDSIPVLIEEIVGLNWEKRLLQHERGIRQRRGEQDRVAQIDMRIAAIDTYSGTVRSNVADLSELLTRLNPQQFQLYLNLLQVEGEVQATRAARQMLGD